MAIPMYSIFVFGFLPESSGKTVISSALAKGMVNRGVKTCVFKPRSGHNAWYQYDVFLRCKSEGRLFCEDIIKLREACKCSLPFEVLNPVDALLSPLDAKTFLKRKMINQFYLFESDIFLHLIAERYTICEEYARNILLINIKALKSPFVMKDMEYARKLKENADEVLFLKDSNEWNSIFQKYGPKAIRSCYRKISEKADCVVVEGFNDAVCPDKSLHYDIVIGVAPGVAVFCDAENFHMVIETLEKLGKDPRSLRAEDIVKYLKIIKILRVPPIRSSYLKDYEILSGKLDPVTDLSLRLLQKR